MLPAPRDQQQLAFVAILRVHRNCYTLKASIPSACCKASSRGHMSRSRAVAAVDAVLTLPCTCWCLGFSNANMRQRRGCISKEQGQSFSTPWATQVRVCFAKRAAPEASSRDRCPASKLGSLLHCLLHRRRPPKQFPNYAEQCRYFSKPEARFAFVASATVAMSLWQSCSTRRRRTAEMM